MILYRRAGIKDIDSLVQFRVALFEEMGLIDGNLNLDSFQEACKDYFSKFISKEEFLSWVAENKGEIIATSGLVFFQKPPSPGNNSGREAYIMNMYTLPGWRSKGIASKLLEEIIKFLKKNEITNVSLHTTEIGRSVYEKTGFYLTNTEMKLSTEE
ncbi:MAG: GNAT family N-acetyltransferase [Promethearchaeota archaeon]